jgi:hypothetical protein
MSDEIGKENKTVVTILRDIVIESGSDDELTGSQKLQLIDLFRNIYNSNFSAKSVRAALQSSNTRMRNYTNKG